MTPETLSVLALTSQYPWEGGPAVAAFNRQHLEALSRRCRVGLVAPVPWDWLLAWPPRLPQSAERPFPIRRPVFWFLPRVKRAWHGRSYWLSAWPAIRRMARRVRPQVILATWLFPDAWAGLLAARRLGLPLVVKLHGSDLHLLSQDPERRPYLRQVLARAQGVTAMSRDLARAARDLGAGAERVHLVPNGVDAELFRPGDRRAAREELGLPQDKPLALYVGRLAPVKGPDLMVEALALRPGVHLAVVGDGPLRPGLEARAAELGLGERITWAGLRPHAEVPRWLAACDCLVLPSRSEGEPNAALEALAAGRPVAAAAVGGVPAVVSQGRLGELAPPEDPAGLAEALGQVLGRQWDPAALRDAVSGRSWRASADELLAVLRQAAREGGTP